MNNKFIYGLIAITLTLSFQATANAKHNRPTIEKRLQNQENRIEQGIREGSLTHQEQIKLYRKIRKIVALKNAFSNDNHLSREERRILQQQLNQSSKKIHRLKNNAEANFKRHRNNIVNDYHPPMTSYEDEKEHDYSKPYHHPETPRKQLTGAAIFDSSWW